MEKIEIEYLANNQQFLEEIASYWCKEWSNTWDEKAIAKKVEKLKKKAQIGKLPFLFVAKKEEKLVGTGGLFIDDLDGREELSPWLGGVYIVEKYRNQGVASTMIQKLINEAKRLGFRKVYLYTENASGLYEKLEWKFMEDTLSPRGVPSKIFYKEI